MKPITYEPCEQIAELLEQRIEDAIADNFVLPEDVDTVNGIMNFAAWNATPEGRLHMQLMTRYVLSAENVDSKRANAIQLRLQSQGKEPKGRPRKFDPRKHDTTTQRKVKLYVLDCLLAEALGIDADTIKNPLGTKRQGRSKPVDLYDALLRFEQWSGLALPHSAWMTYTKEDRMKLAVDYPGQPKELDGSLPLNAFRLLRQQEPPTLNMQDVNACAA